MLNTSVLNSLKTVQRNVVYANLTDLQNRIVYRFLYQPEEYSYVREANYRPAMTALSDSPTQQYINTSAAELVLNNLLLDGFANNRSVLKLLEDLDKLLSPSPDTRASNGAIAPTPLQFQWGAYKFGPCVLASMKYTPTLWLNGEPSQARLDIRLVETSTGKLKTATVTNREAAQTATTTEAIRAANTTQPAINQAAIPVTQILNARQQAEAREAAVRWVATNPNQLPENVRRLVVQQVVTYRVNRNGAVFIVNRNTNQTVHRLGDYDILTRQITPDLSHLNR